MIYTVTLNPALDYVIHTGTLIPGTVGRTDSEAVFYGGKGINVSLLLHRLGIESTALGFVAGFTGQALAAGVQALGVTADFITLPKGLTRINVKIRAQEETDLNARGPQPDDASLEKLLGRLDRLEPGDFLCLSGSVPDGVPQDIYARMLDRASARGTKGIVDAEGELLTGVLDRHPFLVKPNHLELGQIFGHREESAAQIEQDARAMQRLGARNVLVSMAGDGALLLDETGKIRRIGVPQGTVRNSVGAGDSMVAGFLAGYLSDGSYDTALRLGTAAGSATAFSDSLAEKPLIDRLFSEISKQ